MDKAMLVDCPPVPAAFALDLQLHLIQVPFVTQACTPSTQSSGVGRPEFRAPGADRLVRDSYAPLGQQLLDVTQTQAEAEVQPHGVTDDLCRIAIAALRRQFGRDGGCHRAIVRVPSPT